MVSNVTSVLDGSVEGEASRECIDARGNLSICGVVDGTGAADMLATPVRILMLNHNVIWRGTFHRCFQFARPIVRLGHEVTLVTNSATERVWFRESVLEGVRIVESPDLFWGRLRTGWDPLNALRRALRLFREPYDVIHEFDSRPTVVLPSRWKRHAGVRVSDWGDWWGRGGAIADRPD